MIETQLTLCNDSGDAARTASRRASLFDALAAIKARAHDAIEKASARQASVPEASDAAELAARRALERAVGRHALLRQCALLGMTPGGDSSVVDSGMADRALATIQKRALTDQVIPFSYSTSSP